MSCCRNHGKRIVIAIAILFVALPVLAQKTASPTCPSKPIVLALFEFGNLYRDGTGLDKDISDIMAERSGCRFDVRVMQRQYTWPALQDGSIDMTLSAVALPERTAFSWATPYLWMKYMVVLRKDVDPSIHSKADFIADPNLKLGTGHAYVHGRSYDEFVTQLRNIGRVVDVADTDRLFKMFKADRFQAVISTQIAYTSYLKDDIQADKVRIEDWSPGKPKDELNLLISKKNFTQDEARLWGELIKAMNADGTLLRLLSKYVDQADAIKMLAP